MMHNYHSLLLETLDTGTPQLNARTGKVCIMIPGAMLKYDMAEGFPAVTTKKLFFDPVKGELCAFMRGATNAAEFRALGCNIWDANANTTPAWLANPHRKGTDDLGQIYGAQWTNWECTTALASRDPAYETKAANLTATGWHRLGVVGEYSLFEKYINQLEDALRTLRNDPSNRRIIINAWNPAEFHLMALPPCHVMYQFIVDTYRRKLNLCMYQRSADLFLGVPFNIASSSLLLHIMARLSGLTPGVFTHFLADAHIYGDHVNQVKQQLTREHYPAPALELDLDAITDDSEIAGAFARIEPHQIRMVGYQSHAPIKAPMAA